MDWQTAFSQSLNANSTGWNGYNLRQVIDSSLLSVSGSKVRLTFQAATSGGLSIDACYIGQQAASGDPYDFDGTQVQVTVGGSNSFTIASSGIAVSDEIAFNFDKTKTIVVAVHFNATSAIRILTPVTGARAYYKNAANEAGTSNVSIYSTGVNDGAYLVSKIEAFVPQSVAVDQIVPPFGQSAAAVVWIDASSSQAIPQFSQIATLSALPELTIGADQEIPGFDQLAEISSESLIEVVQAFQSFDQSVSLTVERAIAVIQTVPAFGQSAVLRRGDVTPGLLFRGVIGNCSINRAGLATLEARSILTLGRGFLSENYCAACRADLYDARCKVSKDGFSAGATVASVLGQFSFTVTALPDGRAVDGWYDLGQAVIASGDGEGTPFQIKTWAQSTLTVEAMTPIDELLEAGDTLTLYAGCDKSSTTCRGKFSNIINYRGEEYAAGRDLQLTTAGS